MASAPEAFEKWWQALPLRDGEITPDHIRQAWDAGVMFSAADETERHEVWLMEADRDIETYRSALDTAREELTRVDAAMGRLRRDVPTSLRVRRAFLCRTIDALTELAKTLPEH